MKEKAQGALEYLLLIGGAILIAAVAILALTSVGGTGVVNNSSARFQQAFEGFEERVSPSNLAPNPGFEEWGGFAVPPNAITGWPDNWTNHLGGSSDFSGVFGTTDTYKEGKAVYIETSNSDRGIKKENIPVEQNTNYALSVKYKSDCSTGITPTIQIAFFGGSGSGATANGNQTQNNYTTLSVTANSGNNTSATIILRTDAGSTGAAKIWFDEVDLRKACGNKIKETGEECDKSDVGGTSCFLQGFAGGTLACKENCTFDFSGCILNELSAFDTDTINEEPKDHMLIEKDGLYYLFYSWNYAGQGWQTNPNQDNFGYATSRNLTTWSVQNNNILQVGTTGLWDYKNIWAPYVLYYNGTYYMFYTGVTDYITQRIGLATSTDLVNWTKYAGNPILQCNFSWAHWNPSLTWHGTCRDSMVLRDEANNRWVMYFTADKSVGDTQVVGMATSPDLYAWTDAGYIDIYYGPTLTSAESPFVVKHDNSYVLLWWDAQYTQKATADNPLGPWTRPTGNASRVYYYEFAAKIANIGSSQYLTTIQSPGSNLYTNKFKKITWISSTSFTCSGCYIP